MLSLWPDGENEASVPGASERTERGARTTHGAKASCVREEVAGIRMLAWTSRPLCVQSLMFLNSLKDSALHRVFVHLMRATPRQLSRREGTPLKG